MGADLQAFSVALKEVYEEGVSEGVHQANPLRDLIKTEKLRIDFLEKERKATVDLMEALGIIRKNELTQINDTISALMERGAALNAEKLALEALIGLGGSLSNMFNNLANREIPPDRGIVGQLWGGPRTAPPPEPPPAARQLFGGANPNPGGWDPRRLFGYIPSAAHGVSDTGPETRLWMLHPHERVVPANQNTNTNNSTSYNPSVTVNVSVNGTASGSDMKRMVRDIVIPEILTALEVSGSTQKKVSTSVVPIPRKKLALK